MVLRIVRTAGWPGAGVRRRSPSQVKPGGTASGSGVVIITTVTTLGTNLNTSLSKAGSAIAR